MKLMIYVIILLIAANLTAVNHLDVMTFMSGEFLGSEYGSAMASLDFNADGYDDLVVASQAWNPNLVFTDNNRWGKLYFYWGGPGFDNIPDFVIEGAYDDQLGDAGGRMSLYNAGDMNNDGIDDLVVNEQAINWDNQVAVYFGRTNPQTTPDVVLTLPYPEVDGITIAPLGDINGDNHADVSIVESSSTLLKTYIWSDISSQPWLYCQTSNIYCRTIFTGVGDVNGDEISDCFKFTPINATGYIHNKMTLHYGNPEFPLSDSLSICNDTNAYTTECASPAGDVNNDGIADFVAYDNHLWLGQSNLTAEWDVALSAVHSIFDYGFSEYCTGYPFVHGDLNNDGFEDIISSNHEYGGNSGVLTLWMGRVQMNGTADLILQTPQEYPHHNFGWSKVIGDFNADGLCDVAVGAPWWNENDHTETGRVYIYSGNAELHDTTVANEDNTIPAMETDLWQIEVYPNPLMSYAINLNISFRGEGYKTLTSARLTICNAKGQTVYQTALTARLMKNGVYSPKVSNLGEGIYIISIQEQGKVLTSRKVIVTH